jgi:hypothetical protein
MEVAVAQTQVGPETYSIDDEIRVPIVLRDENGVAHVRAVFRRLRYAGELGPRGLDPTDTLELRGNGQNQKQATVDLTLKVADEHVPGDYLCVSIQAYDADGNVVIIKNPTPLEALSHCRRGQARRQEDRVPRLGRLAGRAQAIDPSRFATCIFAGRIRVRVVAVAQ